MANGGRWSMVLLVLVVAGIVAIWPRGGPDDTIDTSGPPGSSPSAPLPEEDADLAALRQRAALQPCPSPDQDAGRPSGPLAGVTTRCLGAPGVVDLGPALAGRTTLLNLWASWCVPCREEMPVLAAYAERPGSIPVLGVNVKEPASAGLAFMAEIGVHYPSLYDSDADGEPGPGTVQQALRTPPVLPVNYLVHPDGSVERVTDPLVFRSPEQIQTAIDRLRAPSR
jgi:thiol-disulfide isomerase/thioredoxin